MELSVSGLRVLITAGASGICFSVAKTFLENGAYVHVCDVSDVSRVEQLFSEVDRHLGGLDVLVNGAGIAGPTARVEDVVPEQSL